MVRSTAAPHTSWLPAVSDVLVLVRRQGERIGRQEASIVLEWAGFAEHDLLEPARRRKSVSAVSCPGTWARCAGTGFWPLRVWPDWRRRWTTGLEDLDSATSAHVCRSVMTWREPCDDQPCAARESTSSSVMAKSPSRLSSTSTFTSSLATQETAGPSSPTRRNARGRSSTATRKRSRMPSRRRTDW